MRRKILWISQLIMAVLLLVYAILSTQVFYNSLVKNTQESLKIYMNLFEDGGYSLDEEGAKEYSEKLSGLRVTFLDRDEKSSETVAAKIWTTIPTARR